MDEARIIELCRQGELGLLDELVHLHADSLYRFCYHLSGNADGAAELFQDTWLKAVRNFHKCKAEDTILGWLFTIAANLQRDLYRRRGRWLKALAHHRLDFPSSPSPEDIVTNQEKDSLVRRAVNELKEAQRIPLLLHYFENYSIETIAALLNVPSGTIKSRLHRARRNLKNRLEVLL